MLLRGLCSILYVVRWFYIYSCPSVLSLAGVADKSIILR